MVQMYTLLGRQVGSHHLAMGVLATVFGAVTLMGSGGQAKKTQGPPINASSSDEENYIKDFLKKVEQDEKKGDAKAAH